MYVYINIIHRRVKVMENIFYFCLNGYKTEKLLQNTFFVLFSNLLLFFVRFEIPAFSNLRRRSKLVSNVG